MKSPLVALFDECWPDIAFPQGCSVTHARNENQTDLSRMVEAVDECGGREGLVTRLRASHPHRKAHHVQYDFRLWDVINEGLALAWTYRCGLGLPKFCQQDGFPDLEVEGQWWIEAKSLHLSDVEWKAVKEEVESGDGFFVRSGFMTRALPPPALRKLDHSWKDALLKFNRVDPSKSRGRLVWFRIGGFDWPVVPRSGWEQVLNWGETAVRQGDSGLVLVDAWDWENPKAVHILK